MDFALGGAKFSRWPDKGSIPCLDKKEADGGTGLPPSASFLLPQKGQNEPVVNCHVFVASWFPARSRTAVAPPATVTVYLVLADSAD